MKNYLAHFQVLWKISLRLASPPMGVHILIY